MDILFKKLSKEHFPLLLKWLKTPHVKLWWDSNIDWTLELIEKKYSSYVKGFKILGSSKKLIYPFIINYDDVDIGYIQYFNVCDFLSGYNCIDDKLSDSCAGIDWYIGEMNYTGRGLGTQVLNRFLNEFVFKDFESVIVDPEVKNNVAIHVYEKVGFKEIGNIDNSVTLMIKNKSKMY